MLYDNSDIFTRQASRRYIAALYTGVKLDDSGRLIYARFLKLFRNRDLRIKTFMVTRIDREALLL